MTTYLRGALRELPEEGSASAGCAVTFWSKVDVKEANDCWEWRASRTNDGYGRAWFKRRPQAAHRVALELVGRAPTAEQVVDHVCRNRACVNPSHLRAVDRYTNVHENSQAVAHLNSLKTHCPQGHPYAGDNLHVRKSGHRVCRTCARDRWRNKYAPHLVAGGAAALEQSRSSTDAGDRLDLICLIAVLVIGMLGTLAIWSV